MTRSNAEALWAQFKADADQIERMSWNASAPVNPPEQFWAWKRALARLVAEQRAEAAKEERERCMIDILDGCGQDCDGLTMIRGREENADWYTKPRASEERADA